MRTMPRTTLALATVISLTGCPDPKDEKPKDDGAATSDGGEAEPKPAVKTEPTEPTTK